MSSTLVECVPNFSEGQDKAKVDAIVQAMQIEGVYVLDREMDADHNRCVITLVGGREAIAEAAILGVGKAAELIDLRKHKGAHPRIGAADVVPFIPIEGVTLEECVAIARHVGEEIWKRYGVPIYFYEAAATKPDRQNLENIRKGQFEGLREEIAKNPARHPDFGKDAIHPSAGATVVGARKPLIAYNVYLNTADVEIAKKVARAVRFSNGGLRYVKAMGVSVRNMAQVSMNLTDFEMTPVARVFEYVKREAARYGVMPVSSEIVGLVPKKALESAAEWFLQIENFNPALILENRLVAAMESKPAPAPVPAAAAATPAAQASTADGSFGVASFIHRLAEPKPIPGGGSAAAASGAMAAALGEMVAGLSRSKKAFQPYEAELSSVIVQLEKLRHDLTMAVNADAASYAQVLHAYRDAKTAANGQEMIENALKKATEVPMAVAMRARAVSRLVESLKPMTSKNMASDLIVAASLARTAREGALANVEINLENIEDEAFADRIREQISGLKY